MQGRTEKCEIAWSWFDKTASDRVDKLVVDSSVVIKWFVAEPFPEEARLILHHGTIRFLLSIILEMLLQAPHFELFHL